MKPRNGSSNGKRMHTVLVPGFGGFDALGQLEYYSNVTPLFQAQRAGNQVLHYFDNFPTAAVATRAARLERYLAKRVLRGEISGTDQVTLVGHSTGGLDIRCLLYGLHCRGNRPVVVDSCVGVAPAAILERVRRVVFLSVPHWGTNLADWVRSHPVLRRALVAELRAGVAGSQVPLLSRMEALLTGGAAEVSGAGLLRAVQDALTEADEGRGTPGPERTAAAHQAASELALYLRHVASNFRAIDDLTSEPPEGEITSPAHFLPGERSSEMQAWDSRGIQALSFVTVGRRLFRLDPKSPAPVLELDKPSTWPDLSDLRPPDERTDLVYRMCYLACAGGPFQAPASGGRITRRLSGAPRGPLAVWDNDGIVNTLSMPWSRGENVLVAADHMDIVGHHRPAEAEPGTGRTWRAYDLLRSASGFGDAAFQRVWNEIFAFSAGRRASPRLAAA